MIIGFWNEFLNRTTTYEFVTSELLAQSVNLCEVPDSRASQGGRVLDQDHLALQVTERKLKAKENYG